eukprot:14643519-Alexandrium_andersonii.AAC.1
MARLFGEASCSRAAAAFVLAGKLAAGESELPVAPDASWCSPQPTAGRRGPRRGRPPVVAPCCGLPGSSGLPLP